MLAVTLPEVTSLVSVLIWPAVVLTIVVVYRQEILQLAKRLSERVSRFSVAGTVSIDLVTASEAPKGTVSAVTDFIDAAAGPGVASSDAGSALQAAIYVSGADFVKIDLRTGHGWLTTRLYIFSLLLAAADVRRLVFVETTDTGPDTFVGIADPIAVADRLATRFPWVGYALRDAEDAGLYAPVHVPRPTHPLSDPTWASYVSGQYLAHPLIRAAPQVAMVPTAVSEFLYSDDASAITQLAANEPPPTPPVLAPDPRPRVTAIAPAFGSPAGGTLVTIVGDNLAGATWIYFGGSGTSQIIEGSSDTELRVVAPPGTGRATVSVTGAAGSSNRPDEETPEFWYTSRPLPRIDDISPNYGPTAGGTAVALTGSGLGDAREVRIGDERAAITTRTETQITGVTPPGAGKAPVAVASPAGSSASTDDWVVVHHVSGSDYAEHADWIRNGDHLVALLRATIDRVCVMQTNDMTTADVQRRALRAAGDFVPVLDEHRQFQRLIDRRAAVERVVAEALETS